MDRIHIADCLIAGKRLLSKAPSEAKIYDIGSGNGLPGIPIAILDDRRSVVLVERDQRKVDFLRIAISRLGLKNVSIHPRPVEELEKGSVKCAVSRGFAALALSLVKVRPLCSPGSLYFHMKGENWARELAQAPSQVFTHWKVEVDLAYELPDSKDHGPFYLILSRMR